MRKIDCISFRITGDAGFKKKLTNCVSKVSGVIELKVKISKKLQRFADTAGAEAMRKQFRCCCFTTLP